jgi:hypothetical protein
MGKSKIHDYVVVLKNQHRPLIEKTSWLLILLSYFPLGLTYYNDHKQWMAIIALIIVTGIALSNYLDKKKNKPIRFSGALIVIGVALTLFSPYNWINVLYILAGFSEGFLIKNDEIGFSKELIIKSGIIPKKIKWSELNNVLIKDGLLTLDFKNNNVFQAYSDDEEDEEYDVEDDEFNAYCLERLKGK